MVKDEDLCVHCGLCAERCPTAAWDMQKFELLIPYAGKPRVHQTAKVIRVNDFALKLANVNGTGSASANGLLMQAIFRMGIPVSGKNLFPSNIQGLPTWYEIRVNKDGHTARALDYDLMVAMNAETYARDVKEVRVGRLPALRLDLAARRGAASRRRHLPRRAARQDVQRDLQRVARADPDEEHRLRRARWWRCSTSTWTSSTSCSTRSSRKKKALRESNHKALRARLRLREGALRVPAAVPPREDGRAPTTRS